MPRALAPVLFFQCYPSLYDAAGSTQTKGAVHSLQLYSEQGSVQALQRISASYVELYNEPSMICWHQPPSRQPSAYASSSEPRPGQPVQLHSVCSHLQGRISVRCASRGVMSLSNVQRVQCKDAAAAMELLRAVRASLTVAACAVGRARPEQLPLHVAQGQENRAVAAHALNDTSSRSHGILTLWVETLRAGPFPSAHAD